MTMRFDWTPSNRPAQLRAALEATRQKVIHATADGIRQRAPHPNIADAVRTDADAVHVDHRAAWFWEVGTSLHMPPVGPMIDWALSVGKTRREAYAVARAGVQLPRTPYIAPSVKAALRGIPASVRAMWGH